MHYSHNEHTPSEVLVHRDRVVIIMRKDEPIIISIKDAETSKSFKVYFNELWRTARK